jgi:formate dehydrogenase subunit gamma
LLVLPLALALVQPGPTAQQTAPLSADEVQLFQELQGDVAGRVSIPDQRAATLIQPAGKEWRDFIRDTLPWVGGILIGGMVMVLALFYLIRGRVPIEGGRSGETITRFGAIDRFAHWLTASASSCWRSPASTSPSAGCCCCR